jgi:DNA-binding CsgD family transcriptional regulator
MIVVLPQPLDAVDAAIENCLQGYAPGWVEFKRNELTRGSLVYHLGHAGLGDLGSIKIRKLAESRTELSIDSLSPTPPRDWIPEEKETVHAISDQEEKLRSIAGISTRINGESKELDRRRREHHRQTIDLLLGRLKGDYSVYDAATLSRDPKPGKMTWRATGKAKVVIDRVLKVTQGNFFQIADHFAKQWNASRWEASDDVEWYWSKLFIVPQLPATAQLRGTLIHKVAGKKRVAISDTPIGHIECHQLNSTESCVQVRLFPISLTIGLTKITEPYHHQEEVFILFEYHILKVFCGHAEADAWLQGVREGKRKASWDRETLTHTEDERNTLPERALPKERRIRRETIKQMWLEGHTDDEIAEKVNVSAGRVKQERHDMGLKSKRRKRQST